MLAQRCQIPARPLAKDKVFGFHSVNRNRSQASDPTYTRNPVSSSTQHGFLLRGPREAVSADTDRVTCEVAHVAEQPAGRPGALGSTQWLFVDVLQDRP
jgi:hypothetical protein